MMQKNEFRRERAFQGAYIGGISLSTTVAARRGKSLSVTARRCFADRKFGRTHREGETERLETAPHIEREKDGPLTLRD